MWRRFAPDSYLFVAGATNRWATRRISVVPTDIREVSQVTSWKPSPCRGRCAARCREGAGGLPVDDGLHAVHQHPHDADREPAVRRAESPGRSCTSVASSEPTVAGSNTTTSAIAALAQHAAVAQPEQLPPARSVISCTARSSDTSWRPRRQSARKRVGVRRAAHAVEVGAGVGAADHGPRVVPHLARAAPTTAPSSSCGHRPQHRAQLVGDHDVEQRAERFDWPRSRRDVADDAALAAPRWPRQYMSPSTVVAPVGEAAEHAGFRRLRRARASRRARVGVAQALRSAPAPAGRGPPPSRGCSQSAQKVRKLMFIGTSDRHRRARRCARRARGRGRRRRAGAARARARARRR